MNFPYDEIKSLVWDHEARVADIPKLEKMLQKSAENAIGIQKEIDVCHAELRRIDARMAEIFQKARTRNNSQRVSAGGKVSTRLSKVDFSESDLADVFACKNCGWPSARDYGDYRRSTFHLMGRWGEQTKCEEAEIDRNKPWKASESAPGEETK